jgi:BMFP domain-containing protein YqiC
MAKTVQREVMMEALRRQYEGRLEHLDITPNIMSEGFTVRMVVDIKAQDELEIFTRLNSVLEVCLSNNVRSE